MLVHVNTLSSPQAGHSRIKNEKCWAQRGFWQRIVSIRPPPRHSNSSACSCRQNGHSTSSTPSPGSCFAASTLCLVFTNPKEFPAAAQIACASRSRPQGTNPYSATFCGLFPFIPRSDWYGQAQHRLLSTANIAAWALASDASSARRLRYARAGSIRLLRITRDICSIRGPPPSSTICHRTSSQFNRHLGMRSPKSSRYRLRDRLHRWMSRRSTKIL